MLANQTVFKNTSLLLLSLVIQKIISFVYFSYLATRLGVTQTGLYFFILSLTSVANVFLDLGLNNLLIKQVAANPDQRSHYFTNSLLLKVIYLVFVNFVLIIGYYLDFFGNINVAVILLALGIINIETLTIYLYSLQRSIHLTIYEAIGNLIFQSTLFIAGYLALQKWPTITIALASLLIALFFNLLFAFWQTSKKNFRIYKSELQINFLKQLFILSWPFALMAIFNRLYGYQDVFLLKAFLGEKSLGYYSLPYKITFVFQFIPLALVASIYPAFSHWWKQDKEQLSKLFYRSTLILLLIVLPLTITIYFFSTDLILNIYDWPYYPSVAILKLLILSLPFVFMNFPVGYLLNACNKQRINLNNIITTLVVGVTANIILIPKYGYVGVAMVSLFCAMLLLILNIRQLIDIINWQSQWLIDIAKIILVVIFHLAILKFHIFSSFILSAITAIIIYIMLVFFSRLLSFQEIIELIKNLKTKS